MSTLSSFFSMRSFCPVTYDPFLSAIILPSSHPLIHHSVLSSHLSSLHCSTHHPRPISVPCSPHDGPFLIPSLSHPRPIRSIFASNLSHPCLILVPLSPNPLCFLAPSLFHPRPMIVPYSSLIMQHCLRPSHSSFRLSGVSSHSLRSRHTFLFPTSSRYSFLLVYFLRVSFSELLILSLRTLFLPGLSMQPVN